MRKQQTLVEMRYEPSARKKLFLAGGFKGVLDGVGIVLVRVMCLQCVLHGLCVFLHWYLYLTTRWIKVWSACEPLENCEHLMDSIEYLVPLGSNFEMPIFCRLG